jgi:integrase
MSKMESSPHLNTSLVSNQRLWPIDIGSYNRDPELTDSEREALTRRLQSPAGSTAKQMMDASHTLHRLFQPIHEALRFFSVGASEYRETVQVMLIEMHRHNKALWGWEISDWLEILGESDLAFAQRYGWNRKPEYVKARRILPVVAYLLDVLPEARFLLETFVHQMVPLAHKFFGKDAVDQAVKQITTILHAWGYRQKDMSGLATCVSYLFLQNRSSRLDDLSSEFLEEAVQTCRSVTVQMCLYQVSRALFGLGMIANPLKRRGGSTPVLDEADGSIDREWFTWCVKWKRQTTLQRSDTLYYHLLKVGRWLRATHPDVTSPAQWTYELAAEFIAVVMHMCVGEWTIQQARLVKERIGQPLRPSARARIIKSMRTFLLDCQEWEWIPRTLNPRRAFRFPRALQNQLGPDPRAIDRPLWAKILWAAMNLEEKDLPLWGNGNKLPVYPLEMVRAIAMVWCFAALRRDEIMRLQVGCIRWQYEDVMIPETGEILPKDATCFLSVPVNKTLTAYTKPVHPLVGKCINEWEQMRPREQPHALDHKTSETVEFLFFFRGKRISKNYINQALIPLLCKKAGIPEMDSRGQITSHRARATIASMLYNAREPLNIFQLQKYLGHKLISSTQHYIQIDRQNLPTMWRKQTTWSRISRRLKCFWIKMQS